MYYRALNARITKKLLQFIPKFNIDHPDQCGSFDGGQTAIALDEIFLLAEDSNYNNKEAWVTLLDCSEAFDSMNAQVTDITLKSAGLPPQIITWLRLAQSKHTRVVTTAGGTSKIADAIKVEGGIQGQPSMPCEWGLLSCAIIRYCNSRGGAGYTIEGRSDRQQTSIQTQKSYVDDAKISDSTKEGNTSTSQTTITMEMVLNIRTNGPKCIVLISDATKQRLLDIVDNWKQQDPNTKPTHPPARVYDGIQGIQLTREDDLPATIRDQPMHVTLHTSAPTKKKTMTLTRTDPKDTNYGYTTNTKNQVTEITPGSPAALAGLKRYDIVTNRIDDAEDSLSCRLIAYTPMWNIKQTTETPTQYPPICTSEAEIMVATHDLFTIQTIALDSSGTLGPAKFTTVLSRETANGFTNDTTKYLGVEISMHRGIIPSQESLVKQLIAACNSASQISKSPRDLKALIATVFSKIDYKLQSIPPTRQTLDKLMAAITAAAIKSTGLTHLPASTGRLSALVFMPESIGLGFGVTDPTEIVLNKAASSILRQATAPTHNERECFRLALDRIADQEGFLVNSTSSRRGMSIGEHQLYIRMRTLFEEGIDIHSTRDPNAPPGIDQHEKEFNIETRTQYHRTTISLVPNNIVYIPTNILSEGPNRTPIPPDDALGSMDLYAAIYMATQARCSHICMVDVLDHPGIKLLHTTSERERNHITPGSKIDIEHALNLQVQITGQCTFYNPSLPQTTRNDPNNIRTWAYVSMNSLRLTKPTITPDRDKYKSWGRVQIFNDMKPAALETMASAADIVLTRLKLEAQSHPTKYENWTEQSTRAQHLQATDASVDQETVTDHMAPDHLKEEYFQRVTTLKDEDEDEEYNEPEERKWLQDFVESDTKTAYVWVAYPGNTAKIFHSPHRPNVIAQDQLIYSRLKTHPLNSKIKGLAPIFFTLNLPKDPTEKKRRRVEEGEDEDGEDEANIQHSKLFPSPYDNRGQFIHHNHFGWGTVTAYDPEKDRYEVTYGDKNTREKKGQTPQKYYSPKELEKAYTPPHVIKKFHDDNTHKPPDSIIKWTLDCNDHERAVVKAILTGTTLKEFSTHPEHLGWDEQNEGALPPKRKQESYMPVLNIKNLAFKRKHVPPLDGIHGPLALTTEVMRWANQERAKRDPTSWAAWLSTACSKSPEEVHKHIDQVISGEYDIKRNTYNLALIIQQARKKSPRTTWETGNPQLICPCLMKGIGLPSTTPDSRTHTCSQNTNKLGLNGTHNKVLWERIIREDLKREEKIIPRKTKYYCLCGAHYPSADKRDIHAIEAETLEPHGRFFDELHHMGGSFQLVDLKNLTVLDAKNFRIPVTNTSRPESTTAEAYTWCQGAITAHEHLGPQIPLQAWIDSQSAQAMTATANTDTSLRSKQLKIPTSTMTATMKTLLTTAANGTTQKYITTLWRTSTHNQLWNYNKFADIVTRLNQNADKGAEEGRLHVALTPAEMSDGDGEEHTQKPQKPIKDYGSQADQRSTPPQNNTGHTIFFTHNKLQIPTPFSKTTRGLRSTKQIKYLAEGGKVGTTARLVLSNIISTHATTYLRHNVTAQIEAFQMRCTYGRWCASSYECARKLATTEHEPFPTVLQELGEFSETCLLCEDHTARDDLAHGRHHCRNEETSTARDATDRITSECTGRTGPCKLPTDRQAQLPPKYRSAKGRFSPSRYTRIPPLSVQLADAQGRITYEVPYTWELDEILNPTSRNLHEEDDEDDDEIPDPNHLTRAERYIEKLNYRRVVSKLAKGRGDGRTFGPTGIQSLPGNIRARICRHMFDIDFDCSHPSIIIDALRKKQHKVPEILEYVVTNRLNVRTSLAKYYNCKPKDIKSLINAITYGRKYSSKAFFKEAIIAIKKHHPIIKEYCHAMNIIVDQLAQPDDLEAAERSHPDKDERQLKFSALSDLLARIEDQKLACIINRLTTHWGINPKSTVLMHDGCMVEMQTLNPEGQAKLQGKTGIDQEILQDLTEYTRESMGVFIRLTVKSGSQATELTCNMHWPILAKEEISPPTYDYKYSLDEEYLADEEYLDEEEIDDEDNLLDTDEELEEKNDFPNREEDDEPDAGEAHEQTHENEREDAPAELFIPQENDIRQIFHLRKPHKLNLNRTPSNSSPTQNGGTTIEGENVTLWSLSIHPHNPPTPLGTLSIARTRTIRGSTTVLDAEFPVTAWSAITKSLNQPETSAEWSLGFTHPEVYDRLGEIFGIRTCVSTITSIPTGTHTKYEGDLNDEARAFPLEKPIIITTGGINEETWAGTIHTTLECTPDATPWVDPSNDNKPLPTIAGIHRSGHHHLPALISRHVSTAQLGQPCIVIIEAPDNKPNYYPPSFSNENVCSTVIMKIPARRIQWTNMSGPSHPKSKTPADNRYQGWHKNKLGSYSPPHQDGQWDSDRDTPNNLNKNKLYVVMYHLKSMHISLNTQAIADLSDTLTRISAPMAITGEVESETPMICIPTQTISLALRHQQNTTLIDPYKYWREIMYQPSPHVPACIVHNSSPSSENYPPLHKLAHLKELIPDGAVPRHLEQYCRLIGCKKPEESAAIIVAVRLKAVFELIETLRFKKITEIAKMWKSS